MTGLDDNPMSDGAPMGADAIATPLPGEPGPVEVCRARMQAAVDELRAAGRGMMADLAQEIVDRGGPSPAAAAHDPARPADTEAEIGALMAGALEQVDGGASIGEIAAAGPVLAVDLVDGASPLILDGPDVKVWWRCDKRGPATFAEDGVRDDPDRRQILDTLDVEAWRVPSDGLLEYDPVHDEWRVEVYTKIGVGGPLSRVIVRRRADSRPSWVDLSPYIARRGGDRLWFNPGPMPANPTMRDLGGDPPAVTAMFERWRDRRMPDRDDRGRWVPDEPGERPYSVSYHGTPPSPALVELVDQMGTKLADAARPVAGALVNIVETARQANDGLRQGIESMRAGRVRG